MNKYYDIIVAGGGPAGMAAAWSAAKGGAKTLLVEKNSFLGGTGTAGGVSMYINWKGDINGQLTDLSGHFYRKLMKALDQCGGRYPMGDNLETNCDFVDIEDVKRLSEAILVEAGVKLLYYTQLSDVKVVNEVVRSVCLTGKNLDLQVECRTLIDCTGDADACRMAGAETVFGREKDQRCQPLTMIFSIGGVDSEALRRDSRMFSDEAGHVWLGGAFSEELAAAGAVGEFAGDFQPRSVSMLWSSPKAPSTISFNLTKILDVDGSSTEGLIKAEIEGRRQAHELANILRKYVVGFADSYLAGTSLIGVRETYRLIGRYKVTEQDVLSGVMPEDSIALCAHVMDSHLADNFHEIDWNNRLVYGIPYRCLVPRRIKGLLAAGRCMSGTHLAAGSYRVIGTASTIGEAAGTIAAYALQGGIDLADVDVSQVQELRTIPQNKLNNI